MTINKFISSLALLATALSCNKEETRFGGVACAQHFTIECEEMPTRAALRSGELSSWIGSETVGVYGFDGVNAVIEKGNLSFSSSVWTTSEKYELTGKYIKYAAYYPSDLDLTVNDDGTTAVTGFTFSYEVPTDAANQKDVMFAYADNSGYGFLWRQNDAISLSMSHALCAVKFKYGSSLDGFSGYTVKKISITGVYASASCTATFASPVTYSWGTGTTTTVSAEVSETPSNGAESAAVFALIPQDFSSSGTVKVQLSLEKDSVTSTIECQIPANNWSAGNVYIYTLEKS